MNIQTISKNQIAISRIATVIIFLALIRCISEPFRLNYYSTKAIAFLEFKPFLLGALTTSLALLTMTFFSYYGKSKIVIAISILTIITLLFEKNIYLIP